MGAPEGCKQHGHACLGLVVKDTWLETGGPFFFF